MVDVGAATRTSAMESDAVTASRPWSPTTVAVRPADAASLADYDAFCRTALHGPQQHPLWVRTWIEATGADALLVTCHENGQPALALPLEVTRQGPFRVARFVGGRHANGNLAARSAQASAPDRRALANAIRRARPDIDLVALERQNPSQEGIPNALADLATIRSPNISLAVDLTGGFQEVLSRNNGKRKRRKQKLQLRRMDEAGGWRLIKAATTDEVDRLIDAFFALKAARFRKKGISNTFAPAEIQAFFRDLFTSALKEEQPPFTLYGLEVAGDICGIHGFSITRDSIVCEFGAIREDDLQISPGFFIDYHAIEEACDNGRKLYDLSVGDEPYKRSWCEVETWQFETLLPLSLRGQLLCLAMVARGRAVRFVKSNETLWSWVKTVRARIAGTKEAAQAE